MTITQDQFDAFVEVRDGGETNMLNTKTVAMLAQEYCGVELTKQEIRYIIANFDELAEKYGA